MTVGWQPDFEKLAQLAKLARNDAVDDATRAELIIDYLFGPDIPCSFVRLPPMLLIFNFFESQPAVFWQVFQEVWQSCDATYRYRGPLLRLLRRYRPSLQQFLRPSNKEFLDRLPDPVQLYRGGNREQIKGLAWSTSRDVAIGFAKGKRRFNPDPALASGLFPKSAILAVNVEREESEVLIDHWGRWRNINITRLSDREAA